ncbi:MAG: RpoL/Rpb11 RNA polymerase subunit family protein [Candidatus Heimdallarchaeota archaeon]
MEIESYEIEDDGSILKMTITGETHTFLNLLRYYLTMHDTIDYAGYTMRHPLEPRSDVFIKAKDTSAKTALLTTLQEIRNNINEFEEKFKVEQKKYSK